MVKVSMITEQVLEFDFSASEYSLSEQAKIIRKVCRNTITSWGYEQSWKLRHEYCKWRLFIPHDMKPYALYDLKTMENQVQEDLNSVMEYLRVQRLLK